MYSATNYGAYGHAVNELFKISGSSPQHFNGMPLKLRPSFPDARNYQYASLIKQAGLSTYVRGPFGYRKNLPPAFNQLNRGSCTAASKAVTVKSFQEINQGDFPINGLSVAFLYAEEKKIDGAPNSEGSDPKSGYIVLQKTGICTEDTMPYGTLSDLPAPKVPDTTAAARQEAAKYKIDAYAQIANPGDTDRSNIIGTMRQVLAREGPFIIDILVCENFIPDPKSFKVPLPNGFVRGLHELAVSDDCPDIGCFEIRNTWGTEWGDNGYCYFPYEWFTRKSDTFYYCFEAWTSTDISVPKAADRIEITPGATAMLVDGKEVYLDQPAQLINGRIMVPVRAAATNQGYKVLPSDGTMAVLVRQA